MDDVQQIDAEEIIGEIREQNRTHQQGLSRSDAASPLSEAAMDADLASLQSSYDIYHIHFTSHRKGVGRLIVLAKQVLRKLLTPILEQQVAYNTANTRVVMANTRIVRFLYNQLEDLRSRQLEDL